jgi:hypothetical protein
MRKFIVGVLMASAMSTVMATVAGPVAAAPSSAVTQRAVAVVVDTTADDGFNTMADWKYVTWFWSKSDCDERGAWYKVRGKAYDWQCNRSAFLVTWDLHILTD